MTIATIEIDVTDTWVEQTDPENQFGEEAQAYLSFDNVMGAELQAVSTDDGDGWSRMNRDVAIQCMGSTAIRRIETGVNADRGYF